MGDALTDSSHNAFNRREFIHGALAGAAFAALPISAFSSDDPGLQSVLSQIPKMHDENVKRLQDWIALPSIAAENRNYPQGPDYMAQLARDAGFANVEILPTSGKPGVFGTLDAGAATTVGIYFMYDVKQFDASEWSSPPLEGRIVDKEGLGRICVGRGAVNQKGPETAFLGALHAFKAAGTKLPVNLVLVCEGEEEIGSTHFPEVVHQPKVTAALKKCMSVFMPEAGQDADGGIQISLGAKGVVELELVSSGERWGRGPNMMFTPALRHRWIAPPGTWCKRSTRSSSPMDTRLLWRAFLTRSSRSLPHR